MKTKVTQSDPDLPVRQKQNEDLSRRRFLQAAAAVGAVAAAVPIAGIAQIQQSKSGPEPEDPMEKILCRYGSEFGSLNRIG